MPEEEKGDDQKEIEKIIQDKYGKLDQRARLAIVLQDYAYFPILAYEWTIDVRFWWENRKIEKEQKKEREEYSKTLDQGQSVIQDGDLSEIEELPESEFQSPKLSQTKSKLLEKEEDGSVHDGGEEENMPTGP